MKSSASPEHSPEAPWIHHPHQQRTLTVKCGENASPDRYYATWRSTRHALVPPNPNEFESAMLISRFFGA